MKRTGAFYSLAVIGATTAFLATLLVAPAVAEEDPIEIVSNGLEIDSRRYAQDFRVSEEEALKRLNVQSGLQTDIPKWSSLAGSRLAGAYIQHEPQFGVVIRLTGTEPIIELDEAADAAEVSVDVQYGAAHSQGDLIAIVEQNNWAALSDRIQGVYADIRTGKINFDFYGSEAEAEELGALLASYKALDSIPTKVIRWDAPGSDANRGGRILSLCTSAFTVRDASLTPGMLSAGHCSNSQSYWWFSGPGPFSMSFLSERWQNNADIQWHTTSAQGIEPLFHADSTTTARAQIGVGVGLVGQYLCRRGTVSGYACTTVTSITYAPAYDGACPGTTCLAVFSLTSGAGPSQGDSGGPWFIGNEPHGITKGFAGSQAIFTRVWYLNTMGVTLMQG